MNFEEQWPPAAAYRAAIERPLTSAPAIVAATIEKFGAWPSLDEILDTLAPSGDLADRFRAAHWLFERASEVSEPCLIGERVDRRVLALNIFETERRAPIEPHEFAGSRLTLSTYPRPAGATKDIRSGIGAPPVDEIARRRGYRRDAVTWCNVVVNKSWLIEQLPRRSQPNDKTYISLVEAWGRFCSECAPARLFDPMENRPNDGGVFDLERDPDTFELVRAPVDGPEFAPGTQNARRLEMLAAEFRDKFVLPLRKSTFLQNGNAFAPVSPRDWWTQSEPFLFETVVHRAPERRDGRPKSWDYMRPGVAFPLAIFFDGAAFNKLKTEREEAAITVAERAAGGSATSAGKSRCRVWLAESRRRGVPTTNKDSYFAEANRLFGVGRGQFDNCWKLAAEDSPNDDWGKAGRRSKKS